MNLREILLCGFLLLLSAGLKCQDVFYFELPGSELTNSEIYTLLFDDSEALLYAGSNQGLHVYKNGRFQEIKIPSSALGNAFFQLVQAKNGKVYCSNFKGQFFEVEEDSCRIFYERTSPSRFNYILTSPDSSL